MNLINFTLIMSPPDNFILKNPNNNTIDGGKVDPASPQLRIYKFDHAKRTYTCFEEKRLREVVGDEVQKVLSMVANMVRGINFAEAELIASILNVQKNAGGAGNEQSPLQKLERALEVMKAYFGDEEKTGIPRSTSDPTI